MVFIAIVLGCLGALIIAGFVILYLKLGAFADELRDAREADTHHLAIQLDAIADKQQGLRLDLSVVTGEMREQQRKIEALTFQLEGPPSMRRPVLPVERTHG